MSFEFRDAVRENVGLLVGISGGTGSGKTYSAMRLATGLSAGAKFAVIDTENGRARHYADRFKFKDVHLQPPFSPDRYLEAIQAADKAGFGVILVDSVSHEWAGEGGILEMQEEELQRMAGNDWKKREACKIAAWIKPKMAHKKMVSRLLQVSAHVILCFRAEEKMEMRKNAEGKMEIVKKTTLTGLDGWVPICEKNLPYELTASFLLTADKPGIPKPIKLQEQHRAFFPLDKPISEEAGIALGQWARGGKESGAPGALASGAEATVNGHAEKPAPNAPEFCTAETEKWLAAQFTDALAPKVKPHANQLLRDFIKLKGYDGVTSIPKSRGGDIAREAIEYAKACA